MRGGGHIAMATAAMMMTAPMTNSMLVPSMAPVVIAVLAAVDHPIVASGRRLNNSEWKRGPGCANRRLRRESGISVGEIGDIYISRG